MIQRNDRPAVGDHVRQSSQAGARHEHIILSDAALCVATDSSVNAESVGAAAVFGDHARKIPVSSNKSMIGHTLSAAGIIEAIFTFLTLEHQRIPPTINYDIPDPAIPFDVVPHKARDARVATGMSNSFGFGGQNVSLIMKREVR